MDYLLFEETFNVDDFRSHPVEITKMRLADLGPHPIQLPCSTNRHFLYSMDALRVTFLSFPCSSSPVRQSSAIPTLSGSYEVEALYWIWRKDDIAVAAIQSGYIS